jgi:ABC-type Fe3+-hydroxamate transport system substrate-binding protein
MRRVVDQMGRRVAVPEVPRRIVSLVPSQTELLYDLGLGGRIVGQTLFCIHPAEQFKQATKIGGTKKLQIQKIIDLQPDLIIGNKEENEKSQIEELERHFPVWMSDITDLPQALQMIRGIGDICHKHQEAEKLIEDIENEFEKLVKKQPVKPMKTLYLIWKDPYMAAGADTFITDVLERAGFANAVETERYPELTEMELHRLSPELVLLSSEPYPFKEKHINELQSMLPKAKLLLVDGEMFSWYGSRLLKTAEYLLRVKVVL